MSLAQNEKMDAIAKFDNEIARQNTSFGGNSGKNLWNAVVLQTIWDAEYVRDNSIYHNKAEKKRRLSKEKLSASSIKRVVSQKWFAEICSMADIDHAKVIKHINEILKGTTSW